MKPDGSRPLHILHCLRAPVGGLFRHVLDLAREQARLGHAVGIVADKTTSNALTDAKFHSIRDVLRLGLLLHPMSRKPGFGDAGAARVVSNLARQHSVDVLHGHGAKGGAYARLAAQWLKMGRFPIQSFYTPHGGTLNFDPASLEGKVYTGLEKVLAGFTDGLIFESDFARRRYGERIRADGIPIRVIANGLASGDFETVTPQKDATDFLFVGELRHLKGVDVLLEALARLSEQTPVTATLIGDGPDASLFREKAGRLGLAESVTFPGAEPAHAAFQRGRCLIVPSRAESFPYIVLEAGAARLPLIATNVGGIPEMVEGTAVSLIAPDDVGALIEKMGQFLKDPRSFDDATASLHDKVRKSYTVAKMARDVLSFYGEVRIGQGY